ncbi:unnamed protein product [Somion occarium]|uniref:ELYS-like domain-containing protein n=1 Tax=Somion occarium TaxID=3059160 RepID=A0ABP1CXG8_9APHY
MADITMDTIPEAVEHNHLLLFETSPDKFAWRSPKPREIEQRRAQMSDSLMFDVILSQSGVQYPQRLYPPADKESLRELLNAIEDTDFDALKKDCLIYYLLKCHEDGREETFKEQRCMPPQFSGLTDAYWYLDFSHDIPRAVSILSDARLTREYVSKIVHTLSLAPNSSPLIRQYIRTAKPLLQEPDDIDLYAIALAGSSLLEAWQYQATFPEGGSIRARLIRKILQWCLSPKPKSTPLTQLLAFPLSSYEQNLIQDFALQPPSDLPSYSIPAIQNLVCVRLIQSGQYAAAIKLDRQFSVKTGDTHRKAAHERRQMMDDILAVMPTIERMLLEQELEKSGHGSQVPPHSSTDAWTPPDLSMSWEYVRPPAPPKANGASAGPSTKKAPRTSDVFMEAPIPQRSGAPRFGGPIPDQPETIPSLPTSRGSARGPSAKGPSAASSRVPQNASAGPSASGVKSKISLFESVGSANKVRNAFYEPPVSAGTKRSFGQDSARSPFPASFQTAPGDFSSASASAVQDLLAEEEQEQELEPTPAEDVEMQDEGTAEEQFQGEGEPSAADQAEEDVISKEPSEVPEREELSFSLFRSKPEYAKSRRLARTETERMMPPGAFFPDSSDGEPESPVSPTPPPTRSKRHHPKPEVLVKSPKRRQTRASTRPRKSTIKAEKLGRSLPGSLMDDDDYDDEEEREDQRRMPAEVGKEEEDVVPPLPSISATSAGPARRATRRSRASKGEEEEDKQPIRPTRRSSRLSVASSTRSNSPEAQLSPVKSRRNTRTATSATPQKATRKQR